MKQLFTFVLAAMAFVACTQNEVEEFTDNRVALPETLTVGFEGGDTRVELNEALKTVWSKGDEVSVFYLSDANQKWQYQGETGERLGTLKCVDRGVAEEKMQRVVVAYPYNAQYVVNTDTHNLYASLPAVQSYKEGSYGSEGNIMVAQSEFTQFSLKSVCGWLRIELTGEGQKVESITLRGNAGEQVAGLIYVDTATAEATLASEMGEASDEEQVGGVGGGLEFDAAVFTEVTLNCGSGVELGSEAKSFYIALLPQTFEQGITIEVECSNGASTTKSTAGKLVVERNHIVPMESFKYDGVVPEVYELAYTTNDGKPLDPFTTEGFGTDFVENIYDAAMGRGVLKFAGAVTTIPEQAFGLCENLTWIDIPEGITTIGKEAFIGCTALEELTIPSTLTSLGSEAFKNCSFKATINCDNVSFSGVGFTEVIIGDGVTTIGENAFYNCDSLTSVTIGDSVTTIGNYAFRNCDSLTSVTIGDSVTTIGDWAFYDCSSLTSVYCKATTPPTLDGSSVFDYNKSGRKIYVPADSVEAYNAATNWSEYAPYIVGYDFETGEAFVSQIKYTSTTKVEPSNTSAFNVVIISNEWDKTTGKGVITFNGELTTIGEHAFDDCDSLTSVTIPDSVTTVGGYAFYDCYSLTSVTIPDSVTTIGENAFYNCDSLTSVTIGDSVTTIGDNAFSACNSLTSVTIPDSVTTIGNSAFDLCTSLTSVTIPDSVTTIGDYAFYVCTSLTSVTIGDSVTTIGYRAFSRCDSLTSVTIPDSVTTIGEHAFFNSNSLTSVYCKATTPPTLSGSSVFDSNADGRKIYVPEGSLRAYKLAENWRDYADCFVEYDFETGEVVE